MNMGNRVDEPMMYMLELQSCKVHRHLEPKAFVALLQNRSPAWSSLGGRVRWTGRAGGVNDERTSERRHPEKRDENKSKARCAP